MKLSFKSVSAAAVVAISLGGCASGGPHDRDDMLALGAVGGAIIGGALGYQLLGSGSGQLIGVAIGAAGGAYGGYALADRLTRMDKRAINDSTYAVLTDQPAGEPVAWDNPESGNSGEVVPLRTFLTADGRLCRDYKTVVVVDGETVETTQTACRNGKGVWIMA